MIKYRHLNWWLRAVMEAFDDARDMWLAAVEAERYATERAMYKQDHPCPQLRDFLIAASYKRGQRAA